MRTRGLLVFGLVLGGTALASQPGSAQVSDRELERPPYYVGAEGLLARRTAFRLSVIGVEASGAIGGRPPGDVTYAREASK